MGGVGVGRGVCGGVGRRAWVCMGECVGVGWRAWVCMGECVGVGGGVYGQVNSLLSCPTCTDHSYIYGLLLFTATCRSGPCMIHQLSRGRKGTSLRLHISSQLRPPSLH